MTCYCVFSSDLHSCRWRQKDDDEQYFYYVELHDWSRSCILPTLEVFLCFCLDRYFLWTARIDPICIAGAYPVFSSAYVFHVRVRVRVLVSTVCSPSWYKLFFWNDFDLFRMPAFLNIHTDSWCWLLRQYSPPRPKLKSLCSCRMLDLAFWISYRGLLCREAQLAVPSSSLLTLTATGRVELHVCQRTHARVDREKITFSKLKNIFSESRTLLESAPVAGLAIALNVSLLLDSFCVHHKKSLRTPSKSLRPTIAKHVFKSFSNLSSNVTMFSKRSF
jgi:hypothetical protein